MRSLDSALGIYALVLGLSHWSVEEVPEQKVRVAMLPLGESRIELLEATAADSPVAGFLARKGEGVHHICFRVENLNEELQRLKASGLRLIDQTARIGAGGSQIAFLHPSGTAGVLIELSQSGKIPHTHSNSE